MTLNLIADQVIKGRIYPALAQHQARPYTQAWREFGQHWPYTTPLRLQEYCNQHNVAINIYSTDDSWPAYTYYPICIGFFDFDIDYIALVPNKIKQRLNDCRLLFYYHEGDNPENIKTRLDALCTQHGLNPNCYIFVSANSAADKLPGFVTFDDFELWYYQRNIDTPPLPVHRNTRSREFVALSRIHKWWRAAAMADLNHNQLLDNSYWSYCEKPAGEITDNPIDLDWTDVKSLGLEKFVNNAPYYCDQLSDAQRNDHSINVDHFFTNAYCNIVLESQFDVDQSGGCFITEKTFKPIKHGQMFFIAGGAGSLQQLRNLGYRVFDGILNNSYDTEPDPTQRWVKLIESIQSAQQQGLANLFEQCRSDIEHNQQLFVSSKQDRLNTLIRKIHDRT